MKFTVPPELTTAITDFILGILAFYFFYKLKNIKTNEQKGKNIWLSIFFLLGLTSFYGAILHGFVINERLLEIVWHPLSFLLGIMASLFVVAFWYQLKGISSYKTALRTMLSLGLIFYIILFIVSLYIYHYFIVFIIYSGICMLASLSISIHIYRKTQVNSSKLFATGIFTMILASVLQGLRLGPFTIIWEFDHNTLYHVVMMLALAILFKGTKLFLNNK